MLSGVMNVIANKSSMPTCQTFEFARVSALLGLALAVSPAACSRSDSATEPANAERTVAATNERTGSVKLSWIPPKTNTDGSRLGDLAGYKIYYGTSKEYLQRIIDIKDPTVTEYRIENLPPYT